MGNFLAHVFSIIFHPLFVPIYGVFIIFNSPIYINYQLTEDAKTITYVILFINTCVVPGAMAFFLYKRGDVTSITIEDQKERGTPYLMTTVFYATTYFLFKQFNFPELLNALLLGATISIALMFIINFFYKISAHMIGIGGLIAVAFGLSESYLATASLFLFPLIIAGGVVAWSRLKLNAHRPLEIYAGLALGFGCEYVMLVQ